MTTAKKRLTWYTRRTYTNKTKLYQYHTIKQEATFLNMKLYNICYTYSTNWKSFGWKVNKRTNVNALRVGIMTIAKKRLTWYTKRTYTNKTKLCQYHTIKQEATFLNMKLYNICYTYSTNWRSFGWKVNKRTPMVSGTKLLVFLHKGPKVHIPI